MAEKTDCDFIISFDGTFQVLDLLITMAIMATHGKIDYKYYIIISNLQSFCLHSGGRMEFVTPVLYCSLQIYIYFYIQSDVTSFDGQNFLKSGIIETSRLPCSQLCSCVFRISSCIRSKFETL